VLALGEAKAGERIGRRNLRGLEVARAAVGVRASGAKPLLFGEGFSTTLEAEAFHRPDVELIDLTRLYFGE